MELALVLRELISHRRALLVGAAVALLVAIFSVYRISGFGLQARGLQHSSASTQVFVDTTSSVLGSIGPALEPLQQRAAAYANFMASPTILQLIGQRARIAGSRLYAAGPVDSLVPRVVEEPTAVERNVEITGEVAPYRLNFNDDPNLPTVGIYAQAPSTKQAIGLANAAAWALADYVAGVQSANKTPASQRVVIHQLGSAKGGVSDGGIRLSIALLAFLATFFAWCIGVLLLTRMRGTWRAAAALEADRMRRRERGSWDPEDLSRPAGALTSVAAAGVGADAQPGAKAQAGTNGHNSRRPSSITATASRPVRMS
jgi:hypothetical protein